MAESTSTANDTVLVTGGSSFIGGYTILKLLERGQYSIRTAVRSQGRVEETRSNLRYGGATEEQVAGIDIVVADLIADDDKTWQKACAGARYVIHVAGMIPTGKEKRLEELLVPLRQGVLRMLGAAKAAGVEKVVFTSSIATLAHGHGARDKTEPLTEDDWTDLSDEKEKVHIYPRAKTLTEQAAWEYVNEGDGKGMHLTVICPAATYGPSLNKDYRASLKLILILCGGTPGMPYYGTGMVDVRDVAELHVRAMESEKANGQRYLAIARCTSNSTSEAQDVCNFVDIVTSADILRKGLPAENTKKITKLMIPNWVMRMASWFDPVVNLCLPDLGKELAGSNAKARRDFQWEPITVEESVLAGARSLKEFGLI
ncbi:uncharacterized protein MYCGRDRAFT_77663 [Zymoseptoria tritici IPO323]|uniref:NAD-dependent epimerase/dehydratase domain-containing protein n=1 Tax=Zymoseptoria tritici (strain CBS 115943 / IPO323) TaxID=336722 RepID=F9XPL8_ZYMTI|nr:uncharacterized protein MYCGRDRAFT_77663 [Zymoseptoria tritici IPO323]EGP82809.1 hypothetical protein MYCGRDRAFT_77663 [Zymoseptoria tritici IPO323]